VLKTEGIGFTPSADFVDVCLQSSFPVDLRIIAALHSSIEHDLYLFLTKRLLALREPLGLTWVQLARQVGFRLDMQKPNSVRAQVSKLRGHLRHVLAFYKEAKVLVERSGVILIPSAPSVPRRASTRRQVATCGQPQLSTHERLPM
jgi:hypothetical protein